VTVAIVPIKSLTHAKSRLAPYLSVPERQELVVQLLRHTVDVLRAVQTLEQIVVVSPDIHGLEDDVVLLPDAGGLNQSLQSAIEWSVTQGIDRVLIVPGDLPYLAPADVRAVLEMGTGGPSVVLARTQDGGTGALCAWPPDAIKPMFGPFSYAKHVRRAGQANLRVLHVDRRGLACDLDTWQDLQDAQDRGHFRDLKATTY